MPFVTSTKGFPEMKFNCSLVLKPGSMQSGSHDRRDFGSAGTVKDNTYINNNGW
jgi:hypothetical protein